MKFLLFIFLILYYNYITHKNTFIITLHNIICQILFFTRNNILMSLANSYLYKFSLLFGFMRHCIDIKFNKLFKKTPPRTTSSISMKYHSMPLTFNPERNERRDAWLSLGRFMDFSFRVCQRQVFFPPNI